MGENIKTTENMCEKIACDEQAVWYDGDQSDENSDETDFPAINRVFFKS